MSQLSNFWAELRVIWDLLDDVAVPAPSHRNRTIHGLSEAQWEQIKAQAEAASAGLGVGRIDKH